jgi:hypothetical protein
MKGLKRQRCMACKRVLEPVKIQWAAGPVCYACYWAAKLFYENHITDLSQLPQDFLNALGEMFRKNGYLWPDDLIQAMKDRHYEKANIDLRRWWSFRCTPEYPCCEYHNEPYVDESFVCPNGCSCHL